MVHRMGRVGPYKEGYIAWLKKGRYFGTKKIVFDADVYKWMVEEIDKFWKVNICGRVEPEIEDSNDILIKYPVHEEGKFIEADSELIEACAELKMIKDQMKSLSQTKDDLEEKIKIRMADAEKVLCKGVTLVTWKAAKESKKFDEKLFKAENEDLYENYTRMVVGSRRFVVK